jgi:Fibronectin type III domain
MTNPDWPHGPRDDAGYAAGPPPDEPHDGAGYGVVPPPDEPHDGAGYGVVPPPDAPRDDAGYAAGPPPDAPADPSPGTSGPSASRGRRRRRRGRGRYVAVAVVLLALAVGVVVWAPWRKPPLLQPTGLASGARTTSSVEFHWSGPATGPSPDKYLILHDGRVISSVPGTVTRFHSTGLAPDTAYQYRVAAVRGGKRSALSPVLTVNTKSPPVSAARWQGRWTVNIRITKGADALRGKGAKGWTEAWRATPTCPAGPCTVKLTGGLNRQTFTATLTRAGAVYTGTTTADVFRCGKPADSVPVKSTLTIQVTITKGHAVNRAWVAGIWAGRMEISTPYTSTSAFYCNAFKLTTTISASF